MLNNRLYELDGLRGIAVILVVIYHFTYAYHYYFNSINEVKFIFYYGEIGVQVFFMISGFVIFMTLDYSKTIYHFFIGRFTRLYPTYWLAILITVLVTSLFPIPQLTNYSLSQIIVNLTMIQGYLGVKHVDGVYWTLSVELFFYIILGILFQYNLLKKIRLISIIWLLLCLIVLVFDFSFEKYIKILLILNWAPLFIAGMMFYKLHSKDRSFLNHIIIAFSLMIFLSNLYVMHSMSSHVLIQGLTPYILVVLAYVLFYLIVYFNISILKNRIFLFLGYISYPYYLIHDMIGFSCIYFLKNIYNNEFFYLISTIIITIVLAYLVTKVMESPTNQLKLKLKNYIPKDEK